jgi:hypothetical protein
MATSAWPTRLLLWLTTVCLLGAAIWYSPTVTETLWHTFHPRGFIQYRGLRVQVPWPWIADTELTGSDPTITPQGLALRKMAPTIGLRLPPQSLFVTVISPDPGVSPAQQTERWLQAFRETHPGSTFEAARSANVPGGASCMSARDPAAPPGVVWTCISVDGGWVANFEGYEDDVPVFFRVVGNLQRSKR